MKCFTKSRKENRSLLYIQNKMKKKNRENESNLIKQSITLNICWYMLSFAKSLNLHVLPLTQTTSWLSKKYLHFLTLLISFHITLSSNLPYSQFFQNSTYYYQTVLVEVIDIMYYKVNTGVSKLKIKHHSSIWRCIVYMYTKRKIENNPQNYKQKKLP